MAYGYAKKPTGRHSYGDGLYLQVSPKGLSVWKLRVREGGKDTLKKLGTASSAHNVHWARARAEELLETGSNRAGTLGAMLEAWIAEKDWSDSHRDKTLGRLKTHLAPLWDTQAGELTRPEFISVLSDVDSKDTAGRLFTWCRECLEDAVDNGELGICVLGRKPDRFKVSKKHRNPRASFGRDYDGLRTLYRDIKTGEATRSVRLASQFLLLSGLRINEVTPLRVEYVQGDELHIPRSVMKEKDHWRGDTYIVPLAPEAKRIIDDALETAEDGLLFWGSRSKRPVTDAAIEKLFRTLTDRKHTPHGTRASLRTFALQDCKAREIVADSLIDHATSKGTGASYDKTDFVEDRRKILKRWAKLIA